MTARGGLAAAILGLAALAAPAHADGTKNGAKDGDELLKFGAATYKQFCSHCHGLDMVNPGTASYDLRRWPKDRRDAFHAAVTEGKGDMPAWGDILTEEEMAALWRYVVTRGGREPAPEAPRAAETGALRPVEPGRLTACLASNGGVMSSRRLIDGGVGLDYEVSKALAAALGLELAVTWFESEQDEENTPVRETYAMLAHRLCDLSPGFALYAPALDQPAGARAAPPRWDGRPDSLGRAFQVDLEPIAVSEPYARMEIGLVRQGDLPEREVREVADLDGLAMGVEQGTLPGVLTLRQGTERMVAEAVTLNPGPTFLWEMETGAFEAALVTVGAYDFHRRQNPITELELADYRHPLGFNLGVAMLASDTALLAAVNEALAALAAEGAYAAMAERAETHYAPPKAPMIQPRITMRDIVAGD